MKRFKAHFYNSKGMIIKEIEVDTESELIFELCDFMNTHSKCICPTVWEYVSVLEEYVLI